jgi:hypothetical protein
MPDHLLAVDATNAQRASNKSLSNQSLHVPSPNTFVVADIALPCHALERHERVTGIGSRKALHSTAKGQGKGETHQAAFTG